MFFSFQSCLELRLQQIVSCDSVALDLVFARVDVDDRGCVDCIGSSDVLMYCDLRCLIGTDFLWKSPWVITARKDCTPLLEK